MRIIFWIALVGSYIAALLPQNVAPSIGDLSDKTVHFIAFAVLMLLLMLAYRIRWWQGSLYLFFYAVWIEITQYCTPTRCAETLDVVADVIGIAIGLLLYMGYQKWGNRE
jgi:VanZ family protein